MMWPGHGFGWWAILAAGLVMVIFWGGILLTFLWAVKVIFKVDNPSRKRGKSHSAMEILDKRYAKGELDKEKYQEMKAEIKS